MGCAVEKTDTGVEVEIHRFDTALDAVRYLTRARRYTFDRHEPWGFTQGLDFFKGSNPGERACLRYKDKCWHAAFWLQEKAHG